MSPADPRDFHLPDLPTAGYSTTREKALSDNVQEFMRQIERDRVRLLTIVLEGREKWRRVAGNIWRGFRVEDSVLDAIFTYFELQACPPRIQRALLRHQQNPQKWRELMRFALPQIERERDQIRVLCG